MREDSGVEVYSSGMEHINTGLHRDMRCDEDKERDRERDREKEGGRKKGRERERSIYIDNGYHILRYEFTPSVLSVTSNMREIL